MNIPIQSSQSICLRLYLSNIDKTAIDNDGGSKSIVLAIVPRLNQPEGATHAAYQLIHGRRGEDHLVVGHAKLYRSEHIPSALQLDIRL